VAPADLVADAPGQARARIQIPVTPRTARGHADQPAHALKDQAITTMAHHAAGDQVAPVEVGRADPVGAGQVAPVEVGRAVRRHAEIETEIGTSARIGRG